MDKLTRDTIFSSLQQGIAKSNLLLELQKTINLEEIILHVVSKTLRIVATKNYSKIYQFVVERDLGSEICQTLKLNLTEMAKKKNF